jgi:hypothetical protein
MVIRWDDILSEVKGKPIILTKMLDNIFGNFTHLIDW